MKVGYWVEWVSIKMLSHPERINDGLVEMTEVSGLNRGRDCIGKKTTAYFIFSKGCWPLTIVSNFLSKGGSAYLRLILPHLMFFFFCCQNKSN